MDKKEVEKVREDICERYFKKGLGDEGVFNEGVKRSGGRYVLRWDKIELKRKYLIEEGREEVIGMMKQEVWDYDLDVEGKG